MTVSALGERALLARIQATLTAAGRPPASLIVGIGDDAAIVTPTRNAQTVLTTDALVDGVHFERRFSRPGDIGHRAMAVNLSDLAAMGAAPRWALVSLALPGEIPVVDVEQMMAAAAALGQAHGLQIIGGNLTRTPGPLTIDVTAVGEVRPRRALMRSGGRPGDGVYVSGTIGGAAAGLEMLRRVEPAAASEAGDAGTADPATAGSCVQRYLRPEPRVRLGRAIAQARAARAAIDLSDGLADAVNQLAEASGCGVEIDAAALPIDPAARAWWDASGQDAIARALTGGDDYELLVAIPPGWSRRVRHLRTRVTAPPLTRIGVLTNDPANRVLVRGGRRERMPQGFEHFTGGGART